MRRAFVLGLLSLLAGGAGQAWADDDVDTRAARHLAGHAVFVDPAVAALVDPGRLEYAARVASRTADGARIKVAFVNVPNGRLNGFRDRLFRSLKLGDDGAVVIATPISVAMRSASLTPDQEAYILKADGRALRNANGKYTSAVAEMTYDIGLVIHNLRPNAVPRGLGDDRNLATFSGRYPGEATGGIQPPKPTPAAAAPATSGDDGGGARTELIIGALVALGLGLGVLASIRRPGRQRG